jgi:hypothetical protein
MFQIETNIPMPERTSSPGRTASIYPLADMYVGDSFLVPLNPITKEDRRRVSSSTSAFTKRNKDLNVKFSIRAVDGGLRVWRVA